MNKRIYVAALDQILEQEMSVLDHGFIRVIDYMGDDSAIVQAARVSYGKGTKQVSQDKHLINYLLSHQHTTPFEMCEIKLHIKLPIFVARQWIRHRTASVNEYSARYSLLDKEFYIPQKEHLTCQSTDNKQGRNNMMLSDEESDNIINILKNDANQAYEHYLEMLNYQDENTSIIRDVNKTGIAREIARINLNLNFYTQFYWKIDLHNLMHFLKLRCDSHAQYEIRVYALKILEILKIWVPYTYEAFENHMLHAAKLSKHAIILLNKLLKGEKLKNIEHNLSQRELNHFCTLFNLKNEHL
jgi:thymidylate synthase (FAD)